MNTKMVFYITGKIIVTVSLLMLLPLMVALYYKEIASMLSFIYVLAAGLLFGLAMAYLCRKKDGVLFDILIDKFNLNPSECYFIDDMKVNIDEAFKRNIKGFVFDNNIELLYEDMRSNGIDI